MAITGKKKYYNQYSEVSDRTRIIINTNENSNKYSRIKLKENSIMRVKITRLF